MTLSTDVEQPKPSAFDHSPETDAAAFIILTSACGYDLAAGVRLNETSKARWKGVAARIEGVGPDHGKAILRVLNPFALDVGISAESATAVIEVYCRQNGLTVPEISDEAKTMLEGAFSNLPLINDLV